MSNCCKGICVRFKARKSFASSPYAEGQKRCQGCELFIKWEGRNCPCCGKQLRTRSPTYKGKEQEVACAA